MKWLIIIEVLAVLFLIAFIAFGCKNDKVPEQLEDNEDINSYS